MLELQEREPMKITSYLSPSRLIYLASLLVFSFFSSATFACTTDNWLAGATGAVTANDPNNGVARVNGLCGLQVDGLGRVQDGSPSGVDRFNGRFYFFPQLTGSGSTDLFVAYSDEGATAPAKLFSISYDGTNVTFDATAISGTSVSVPADPTHWNLIEFSWISGSTGSLWVNSDATVDPPDITFSSGNGVAESVQLGAPNGLGGLAGQVTFDEYESRHTEQIGMLLAGDANLDGSINSGDIDLVVAEFLTNSLALGVVDCNLDGSINSGDIDCVVAIFLGL
jgi:hypothetical protein